MVELEAEMENAWRVLIKETTTGKVERELSYPSESAAERAERGVLRNLDSARFHTELLGPPPGPKVGQVRAGWFRESGRTDTIYLGELTDDGLFRCIIHSAYVDRDQDDAVYLTREDIETQFPRVTTETKPNKYGDLECIPEFDCGDCWECSDISADEAKRLHGLADELSSRTIRRIGELRLQCAWTSTVKKKTLVRGFREKLQRIIDGVAVRGVEGSDE